MMKIETSMRNRWTATQPPQSRLQSALVHSVRAAKTRQQIGSLRTSPLKQGLLATPPGGKVSIPGIYGGMADKFPLDGRVQKGLQVLTG